LAVLLTIPVAAVLVTLLNVFILKRDPAEEDVPSVIFPAKTPRMHKARKRASLSKEPTGLWAAT
jgi:hypothetical protein